MMVAPIISFRNVTKRFGSLTVLDRLTLDIAPGEKVALIGRSGSGKSTLLRTLMTLERIDEGSIHVCGQPLWHMEYRDKTIDANEAHLRKMRSHIGMVFQQFNLFPHMTALRNVMDPLLHVMNLPVAGAKARAEEMLGMVGLRDKLHAYPASLSGGQQQRVAIARAMAMRPKIMLFDEVTSALDPELVGEVLGVLRTLASKHDLTMIMVTHQMGFAREIADRVLFFDNGAILEQGAPSALFGTPRHDRTKAFLSAVLAG